MVVLAATGMDQRGARGNGNGNDLVIDIENGDADPARDGALGWKHSEKLPERVWDGFPGNVGCGGDGRSVASPLSSSGAVVCGAVENPVGDKLGAGEENGGGNLEKKHKKKNCKKPPKPPRPPKAPSLDEADQKLIREITELAMMRRARIERMKALKKLKNAKPASSNVNIWAFIITAFFCFVIFWQGFCSRSGPELGFEGSPISSSGNTGGFISVQYYQNIPSTEASPSSSTAPNIVEQVSGLDIRDEPSILTRPS